MVFSQYKSATKNNQLYDFPFRKVMEIESLFWSRSYICRHDLLLSQTLSSFVCFECLFTIHLKRRTIKTPNQEFITFNESIIYFHLVYFKCFVYAILLSKTYIILRKIISQKLKWNKPHWKILKILIFLVFYFLI